MVGTLAQLIASAALATPVQPHQDASVAACPACVIQMRRVATLGASDGDGRLRALPSTVTTDSRGRFYVTTPDVDELPYVYDARGRFLRQLGRRGRGPGEFLNPAVVLVLPGDTVAVIDQANPRITWLSPQYEVVRTAPAPAWSWSAAALGGGEIVINARLSDSERIGLPLHAFDGVGKYRRSFGAVNPVVRPSEYTAESRWLASSRSGGVWSAPFTHEYVIEHWDGGGNRTHAVTRRVDWFPRYERFWFPTPERPPPPRVQHLFEDAGGRLWVIAWVADAEWDGALKPGPIREGQRVYTYDREADLYDSIIEVVEPRFGELVVARRYDDVYLRFVSDSLIAKVRRHPDGWFLLEIERFEFVSPTRR